MLQMFGCCGQEEDRHAASGDADVVRNVTASVPATETEPWDPPAALSPLPAPVEAPALPPPKVQEGQASRTFDAVLQRLSTAVSFGWQLDVLSSNALHVEALSGDASTAVAKYNASAPADMDIREGDYVTHVDCAAGSVNSLLDALGQKTRVKVSIQRPASYTIELDKGSKPLGIKLTSTENGRRSLIAAVIDGAVKEQAPEVSAGDRIVSVSGKKLSPNELVEALRGDPSPKIEIAKAPTIS